MKRRNTIVIAGLALSLFAGLCFWQNQPKEEKKLPKMQRIDKAIEQEFDKTVDLTTGEVPRERLAAAAAYADRLRNQPPSNRAAINGVTWQERGPSNVSGRTRAILVDENDGTGNTLWAGGVGGGLWKTTNALAGTPTWTPINDLLENMAVSSIAQDPSNPQIMYFGTGEGWFNADAIRGLGIWKTTNGGTTWTRLTSTGNSTFHYVMKLVVAANGDVLATTRNGGLQRSTNGGTNWSKVLGSGAGGGGTNRAADIEIAANGDLYCSLGVFSSDGVYKSTDGGTNWTKLAGGLPAGRRIELAVAPSNANRVYAILHSTSNNDCGGIYQTSNGGTSWVSRTVPSALGMTNFCRGQAWYDLIAAVDPNNDDRIYIGGIDLLLSTNGGTSWTQVSQWYGGGGFQYVHADQHAIVFQNGNSNRVYFGNDGGVFRSTNGAATNPTINFIANGYNVTQFYAADIHPNAGVNEFLAGAQDNGTHRFTNAGINSTVEVTGGDGAFCHIDQDQPNIQISSYVYNAYRITSNSWGSHVRLTIGSSSGSFINPTDYDSDNNVLYGTYNNGQYSYITGVGSSNTTGSRSISQFNNGKATTVRVSPNVANRVYFGLSNGEVVRVDNANTSSATGTVVRTGSGSVSCVTIEDGNEDHILITYSNYGSTSAYESTNGGTGWTSIEGNLPDMPVRWIEFAPNNNSQALVATELGVWSTDALNGTSTNWGPTNGGLANTRIDMLAYRNSDNMMIAATHGRGLFSTDDFGGNIPTCDQVSNLSVTSITTNSAQVSWSAANGAVNYNLRYRAVGAASWTTVNNVTATSQSITGLSPSTNYEWQVRTNCATLNSVYASGPGFTTNVFTGCSVTVSSYPYSNDFEAGILWTNVTNDDFDWTRQSGGTPSSGTGPTGAAEGSFYAYMEVSTPNYPSKTATLVSPCFDLSGISNPEISFQYHMLASPGTIRLEASTNGTSWTQIWSQTGDQGSNWVSEVVGLNSYTSSTELRLRFRGTSGTTWQGDICIDDIEVKSNAPTCDAPTNLSISGITTNSAALNWVAAPGATNYDVRYRAVGSSTWTNANNVTGTSYTATGLTASTTYEWEIRTSCGNLNSNYLAGQNFTTLTPPCDAPTNLAVSGISINGATLGWSSSTNATNYDVRYRVAGTTTWTNVNNVSGTSQVLTGLAATTTYEWQVRTSCGNQNSGYTAGQNFTTLTPPCDQVTNLAVTGLGLNGATLVWSSSANATNYNVRYRVVGTTTWTNVNNVSGTSQVLTGLTATTTYEWQVRTNCAANNSAYTAGPNFTTLTPPCNAPANLNVTSITATDAILNWGAVSGAASYNVRYRLTGSATWTNANNVSGTSYGATGLNASATYEWEVRTNCATNNSAYTAGPNFTTLTPPCDIPSGLAVLNVTQNSANVTWSVAAGAVSYTLEYRVNGTGTWTTVSNISGTTYTITGLAGNTTYEWELSTNCGTTNSVSASGPNFTTSPVNTCSATITNFPYTNSFESTLGWSNVAGDDFDWTRRTGGTPSSGTGPNNAAVGSYYAYMEVSSPNYPTKTATLESACFDLSNVNNPEIRFQYHMLGSPGTIRLEASTDGLSWSQVWSLTGDQGSNWQLAIVNLANYTNSNSVRLRYRGTSGSTWQGDICIDDIRVGTSLPSCGSPSNLATTSVSTNSAIFTWSAGGGANSYNLQYRVLGAANWTTVGNIAGTTHSLSGLTSGTDYEWQVQSNCTGVSSPYVGGPGFTTGVLTNCVYTITSFPFSNDFESSLGWFNATAGDDFDWTRQSGGTPSSGTCPAAAAQGSFYAYMEVSSPNYPSKTAILNGPCLNLTNLPSPEISFQYHMLGSPGTLNLEVSTDGITWAQVWSENGDQGANWQAANASLANYTNATNLRVRFNGTSGTTWQGDICIDDIVIQSAANDPCPPLDFTVTAPVSYGGGQDQGQVSVQDAGATVLVENNGWKAVLLNYTVTANTVIEFDFRSTVQGEIHGIGFDNDNNISSNRTFKVHGTQSWGYLNYDNYTGNTWTSYVIPVGNFYTGSFDRLAFICDSDGGAQTGNSYFRNVRIYEGSCSGNSAAIDPAAFMEGEPQIGIEPEPIGVKVSPNPFSQEINIQIPELDVRSATIDMYNAVGKKVWSSQAIPTGASTRLLPNVPAGIYIIRVRAGEIVEEVKLVKTR
ncbi:MAG: fibronectin type III domain-containing protein [Bacteroidia bacterium]